MATLVMKENTWYQLAPWNWAIKLNNVYFIYWAGHNDNSQHISAVTNPSGWITEKSDMYEMGDKWPNWKENLVKTIFINSKDSYSPKNIEDGILHIRSFDKYWNWGN